MLPLRDVKIKTLRGAVNSCAWTGLFEIAQDVPSVAEDKAALV